jgi:hypothetical protein
MKITMIAAASTVAAAAAICLAATAHADPAVNLPVNDTVRAELVTAGAVLTGVPASEFTGLRPGKTYYAYDPNTRTYWAAAALQASPTSFRAGVNLQDQNSYMIFKEPQAGTWIPYADGYGGAPGQVCPLPPAILDLWQWPPGACGPGF